MILIMQFFCGIAQDLGRLNAPKVHSEWRTRLRAAKLEELKAEVRRMIDDHEHAVGLRDGMIQVHPGSSIQY